MAEQNVYDNRDFFDGYWKLRKNEANANILIEKPALFSLLPDLKGTSILDLGCGYGENCAEFIRMGAAHATGIDISAKMLAVAEKENCGPFITYRNMPMEDIAQLNCTFDIVVSSLAVHYVQDFSGLVHNIYSMLNPGGLFIFSQENPLNTCFSTGKRWTKDENGNALYANISNYSTDGERRSTWFIDNVTKYHRTFSSILNTLIDAGFEIQKLLEPVPPQDIMDRYPQYRSNIHKPDFLLIRAGKKA